MIRKLLIASVAIAALARKAVEIVDEEQNVTRADLDKAAGKQTIYPNPEMEPIGNPDRFTSRNAGDVAGEAYQVIGEVADKGGLFDHPDVQRALDFFASVGTAEEILPFEVKIAAPDAKSGLGVLLLQARHALLNMHAQDPKCGYRKMADACEEAALASTDDEPDTKPSDLIEFYELAARLIPTAALFAETEVHLEDMRRKATVLLKEMADKLKTLDKWDPWIAASELRKSANELEATPGGNIGLQAVHLRQAADKHEKEAAEPAARMILDEMLNETGRQQAPQHIEANSKLWKDAQRYAILAIRQSRGISLQTERAPPRKESRPHG